MQKVYLAGGLQSDWQSKVKELSGFKFLCPREKETPDMTLDEYSTWDLHFVKSADIIFAYMETGNPSGIGMSIEMGYAKALGKTIILVLEDCGERNKSLSFMKKAADITFDNLSQGIFYLEKFNIQ